VKSFFRVLLIAALAFISVLAHPLSAQSSSATIVLVHGAFADGSSWDKVTTLLQAKGYKVVAVHLPLSSLADDVATTQRAIAEQTGAVVLVGHSWGGMVITVAGSSAKVKSLVYVSAFMPDQGQSASDLLKPFPPSPGVAHPIADSAGFLTLSTADIQRFFAPDVSPRESSLIAAKQAPIRGANFGEPATGAAWKSKPTWLIAAADDQMISPELYPAQAKRTGAKLVTLNSSHVSPVSHPSEVAKVIEEAATAR
jgi:pimeloyl-ACP methyl ester carboxylesterase